MKQYLVKVHDDLQGGGYYEAWEVYMTDTAFQRKENKFIHTIHEAFLFNFVTGAVLVESKDTATAISKARELWEKYRVDSFVCM